MVCGARNKIGINPGKDQPTSQAGQIVKERAKQKGIRLLDDVHGLSVFPEDLPVRFISLRARLLVEQPADRFVDAFRRAFEPPPKLSRKQTLALELYAGWVRDGERKLPDSHLRATQRLFAVVEWLYHALQEREMDAHTLREGLQGHIAALGGGDSSAASLIADEIRGDPEVRYLLRRRLGEKGVEVACRWLQG